MVLTAKLGNSKCLWKNIQMRQAWNCASVDYTPSALFPSFPPPEKFPRIYAMSCLKLRIHVFFSGKSQPLDLFHYSQSGWNLTGFLHKENSRMWEKIQLQKRAKGLLRSHLWISGFHSNFWFTVKPFHSYFAPVFTLITASAQTLFLISHRRTVQILNQSTLFLRSLMIAVI